MGNGTYTGFPLRNFLNKSHVWGKPQTFLNVNKKKIVADATIVVGAEAANVINVAIQLKAADGSDIAYGAYVKAYLSSDEDGHVPEATGPDSIAIGTDGALLKSGGDSVVKFDLRSEDDGDIDINMTKASEDTMYLCLIMPDGTVKVSDAITFDATT